MIKCPRCQAENSPTDRRCRLCGADLLPDQWPGLRAYGVVMGLVLAAVFGVPAYLILRQRGQPALCLGTAVLLALLAAIFLGSAVNDALKRRPLYERFARRARDHTSLDPEQAIADLGKALESAPEKERIRLLQERAGLYEGLGMRDEARADWQQVYLAYGRALEKAGGDERVRLLEERARIAEEKLQAPRDGPAPG